MCQPEESYSCPNGILHIAAAIVLQASVVKENRMWRNARMWEWDALLVSETCLSKYIPESEWTPKFLIDDWSLMGKPATEMDAMDSAKKSIGLDLGLKNAMATDLDRLRWRPLLRSQLWTLWVQDFMEATWCASIDKLVPIYSWVSSAYWWKDTMLLDLWHWRLCHKSCNTVYPRALSMAHFLLTGVYPCMLLCWAMMTSRF